MLTGGYFSEPETHVFIDYLLQQLDDVIFVNGGCNVGEFIIKAGRAKSTNRVLGYDIHPDCIEACRRSIQLNGLEDSCTVHLRGLGSEVGTACVSFGQHAPQGTNLFDEEGRETRSVDISTLDQELKKEIVAEELPYVVLLDVEGYEKEIMKGSSKFVESHKPIIIFEYNEVSRHHFTLDEVREELGEEYIVYRLTSDGFLDIQLDHTWNCVAVPCDGREDVRRAVDARIRDCSGPVP
jgi:FkbM family methyltransferase